MTRPDLHLHTRYSDGVLTPEALAGACERAGVDVMAITDHDTFAGSDALQGKPHAPRLIPGVELSLRDMHGLHLLGYGLAEGRPLRRKVEELAHKRVERAREMLRRLAALGMPLDEKAIRSRCKGTVGRPHVARAMVAAGYVGCMQEAFEKYLGHDKPAYVPGERLSMAEALPLMRESGFVPVLAHPLELGLAPNLLASLLEKWQSEGLMGMEVYHPSAQGRYGELDATARRMGLMVTGGSDFHQENDNHGRIGATLAYWARAQEDMEALLNALESAGNA